MSSELLRRLVDGTHGTRSGARVGCEIETDFVDAATGEPIALTTSRAILATTDDRPPWCRHHLELGRQKIELAISPTEDVHALLERATTGLQWLYARAERFGAKPLAVPALVWPHPLLAVENPRDQLWVEIDGAPALEPLCRCSSVQFTIDVHPDDAIGWIDQLWRSRLHVRDYAANDRAWRTYLDASAAHHARTRYGGPDGFDGELGAYAREHARHPVLMHAGRAMTLDIDRALTSSDFSLDSYLRSVWWHYRLRRFGDTLALEIRPIARRSDHSLAAQWNAVADVLGLQQAERT